MSTPIDMSDASDAVIAVLGGMGSYSTLHFFEELLRAFPAEKEWQRPRIVIDNNCVLPSRVRAVLYDERRRELVQGMAESIRWLMQTEPTCITIPCNTAHLFLPEVSELTDTSRVLDMIDITLRQCSADGLRQLGLLATEGTIAADVYPAYAERYDIDIVNPSPQQLQVVRSLIEAIKQNTTPDVEAAERLFDTFATDGILLGCTELSVLASRVPQWAARTPPLVDPVAALISEVRARCA